MILEWLEDAVQHHGGSHAVVQRDAYLSVRGLLHRAARRAKELNALGVGPGHAVGVMLGNVSDALVSLVAIERLGAAALVLPPLSTAWEMGQIQRALPLRALITRPGAKGLESASRSYAKNQVGPAFTRRVRLSNSLLTCAVFALDEVEPLAPEPLAPEILLLHVLPGIAADGSAVHRFVMRSADSLRVEAEHLAAAFRFGTRDRERVVACLAFDQPLQLELVLCAVCGYGVSLYMDDDLAPRPLGSRLREGTASIALVTRSLLAALVEHPSARALPEETRLVCVDGPVGKDLARRVKRRLGVRPEGALHDPQTGLASLDAGGRSPASVGLPLPGVEVRVLGAQGEPVAAGRLGRLQVRSAAASSASRGGPRGPSGSWGGGRGPSGSWGGSRGPSASRGGPRGPSESSGSSRSGKISGSGDPGDAWVDAGWRGSVDRQGRVRLRDRIDDQVLVAGLPVSLGEVEAVLRGHPAVQQARARLSELGQPSPGDGVARIHADVVLRREVNLDSLVTHCERRLSPHKVPGQVTAVDSLS